jgi:hypothetical protein
MTIAIIANEFQMCDHLDDINVGEKMILKGTQGTELNSFSSK